MALLYRAVWSDSVSDAPGVASEAFQEWIDHKSRRRGLVIEPPGSDGRSEGESGDSVVTWIEREPEGGGAKRFRLVEQRDRETYTTTLTVTANAEGESWWWLDLERDSDDPFQEFSTVAPHLATMLLDASKSRGGDPRLGEIRLTPRPVGLEPIPLKAIISRPDRLVPIVVFSHDPHLPAAVTAERAKHAATVMAGTALVVILADAHVDSFRDEIGKDLAVWAGAVRIYLPAPDRDGLSPRRHRYIEHWRLAGKPRDAAIRIAAEVASAVASRRPPSKLAGLDWGQASEAEWIAALEADNAKLVGIEQVAADRADEIKVLSSELKALRRNFAQLIRGDSSDDEETYRPGELIPDDIPTVSGVVEAAGSLRYVEIPEGAARSLDELDAHTLGDEWARLTRLALLSLDSYAENCGNPGDHRRFDWWCDANASKFAYVWPSTRFAEGETGLTKRNFGKTRDFPVSTEVEPTGIARMYVHLQIANEWPLSPRLYFHDDTRGSTGKIHIGFVGPHRLVPNSHTK